MSGLLSQRLSIFAATSALALGLACATQNSPKSAAPNPTAAAPAETSSAVASATLVPSATPTPSTPSATLPATSDAEAGAHLVLAHLELSNARGETLVLEADGTVTAREQHRKLGKLLADGRFLAPDGSLTARLTATGEILTSSERRLPVRITEEGAIQPERGAALRFGTDGRLEGGNPNAPETRILGVTATTQRTAAFLLVLAGFPRNS
jgi:hypothetical protein